MKKALFIVVAILTAPIHIVFTGFMVWINYFKEKVKKYE